MSEKYNGRKALVVDDVEVNRFIIRQQLKSLGFLLDEAVDGSIALEMAEKGSYDLILMDMQMPVMNGIMSTEKIRELGLDVPIIAMTAHSMSFQRDVCIEAGCNAFLVKPVAFSLLSSTIDKLVK